MHASEGTAVGCGCRMTPGLVWGQGGMQCGWDVVSLQSPFASIVSCVCFLYACRSAAVCPCHLASFARCCPIPRTIASAMDLRTSQVQPWAQCIATGWWPLLCHTHLPRQSGSILYCLAGQPRRSEHRGCLHACVHAGVIVGFWRLGMLCVCCLCGFYVAGLASVSFFARRV